MTCVYVAIGQKASSIKNVVRVLEQHGAMDYTHRRRRLGLRSARCGTSSAYSGVTMGEYFRDRGQDALIIYDDLSKQAVAYRQVSLLLRRPPGREAYPATCSTFHSACSSARRVNADYVEVVRSPTARSRATGADRAADHRDAGRRRVGLRADQRDLDHRRPDLPRDRRCSTPASARHQRRYLGVARGRAAQTDWSKAICRAASAPTWRSTASWRRSRSSPPTWTTPRASSSIAAPMRHRAAEAGPVQPACRSA